MKKLQNLGKILSRNEQKTVFGGLSYLKVYDEYCSVADSLLPPGCPCSSSDSCQSTSLNTGMTVHQMQTATGTCEAGKCH